MSEIQKLSMVSTSSGTKLRNGAEFMETGYNMLHIVIRLYY